MKRHISIMLLLVLVLSNTIVFARTGDIIHTELNKVYRYDNTADINELSKDVLEHAKDQEFLKKFYREVDDEKFINIVEEETKQTEVVENIIEHLVKQGTTDLDEILKHLSKKEILNLLEQEFNNIIENIAIPFDETWAGMSWEEYQSYHNAPKLKTPDNYSIPVPGFKEGSTKIAKLKLPAEASEWRIQVSYKGIEARTRDTVLKDGTKYVSGKDIVIEAGQYLVLYAVDKDSKIKAYANIEIDESMINIPKKELSKDESIDPVFSKGKKHSGATKISNLEEGDWKLSVLDTMPEKVYDKDKFDSIDYENGIEIVVANDDEIDNMDEEFKKYLIIYSMKDGKIEKYNIVEIKQENISGALEAEKLVMKTEGETEYNYSHPVKGYKAGTTKIEELQGLEKFNATKWMYIVGNDLSTPKLDRIMDGSMNYETGQDINIKIGQNLVILATDNMGRVKAYGMIKSIEGGAIKNPLAKELTETTHYTRPVKGAQAGYTQFSFLKYDSISEWKYVIGSEAIPAPEVGSTIPSNMEAKNLTLNDNISEDIEIAKESELKQDNGFVKYMMIYGLDSDYKIQVYKSFIMNDSNVKMPIASELEVNKNYSQPIKGSSPNTTRIEKLEHTGLSSTQFRYKVIDEGNIEIEFNEKIQDTRELRANANITVETGKKLLILAVDNSNRTKAYAIIPLTFDNVKAGNAPILQATTHYQGPVPGNKNSSTKFTFLGLPDGAEKWVYKIGDTRFGIPEAGDTVKIGLEDKDYKVYTADNDIVSVSPGQYLLLLAVNNEDKIIAYREFPLTENQVKGQVAPELVDNAHELIKGDKPSTTRLKLEPLGLDNSSSIRWRYKLVDSKPENDTEKPYLNQIVADTIQYNINSNTKIGPDIHVNKTDDKYGYILLLATDSSGKTKAYKYIEVKGDFVKEHSPEIGGADISLEEVEIDSVKITGLNTEKNYKYLISNTRPETPATGDALPAGVMDYTPNESIRIHIGKFLTVYEIDDSDGKIKAYKTFEVKKVKQGSASISNTTIVEGNIRNGGTLIEITLTGAEWADVRDDKSIRDKLFNGFKADSESSEWSKVVASLIADGKGSINVNDSVVTILLPETLDYDIKDEQKISLIIPPEAIKGALNPIEAKYSITIKPTVGATISGDVVNSIVRESGIKAGGKTIVVELIDGIWASDVSGIIKCFDGRANWDIIKDAFTEDIKSKNIVRNSGTKVTITLPPIEDNNLSFGTTKEDISLKIPVSSNLVQGATEDIVATPIFAIYPDILQIKGEFVDDKSKVILMAPDYRVVDNNNSTWVIDVKDGNLKDDINNNDVIISGLPRGLKADVSKVKDKNQIKIEISGTASSTLTNNTIVSAKIKGTAVTEPNSIDSKDIEFELIRGDSIIDYLKNVEIDVANNKLIGTSEEMEYSINSTNGSDGDWLVASSGTDTEISEEFTPGKVYVREKANPKVFHLVATLSQGKAPTGISISKVDYSEKDKVKVRLDGLDNEVEYDISIDGDKKWKSLKLSHQIELTKESDLRIRYSATKENLSSLPTAKLNGLYLGDVELKVGAGLITGTNSSMQYSLDSTNGVDGRWTTAKANETPVTFNDGNRVWIRQQSSKVNFRKLGDIEAMEVPNLNDDVVYNILEKTITNKTGQDLEYKVVGRNWYSLNKNFDAGNVVFGPGELLIRTKGSDDKLPSKSIVLDNIPNPIDPPELKGDDNKKTISYWNEEKKSWEKIDDKFEYKIGANGDWQSGEGFSISKDETAIVYVRKKATEKTLPSKEKAINFTKNLTFENIVFNISGKYIEGTTTNMEYSINSKSENNGIWKTASNNKTYIEPFEGMYIWLREKNKPSTEKLYIGNLDREKEPVLTYVYYNVETSKIANDTNYNLEYRIANGDWLHIDAQTHIYGVEFKPGKLEFRQRATYSKMESHPSLKATIASPISGPKVDIDDVDNKIISINGKDNDWGLFEYRINPNDNSPWISGEILATEDFSGEKIVEIRKKADNETLSSQITKLKFTKNLELEHIILSNHIQPMELNGTTTQMEYAVRYKKNDDNNEMWYKITLQDGSRTMWMNASDGNTILPSVINRDNWVQIIIRDKNQRDNQYAIWPKQD